MSDMIETLIKRFAAQALSVLLVAGLLVAGTARARTATAATPAAAAASLPAEASPQALSQLIATLNDPQGRQQLINELQLLLAAQQAVSGQAEDTPAVTTDIINATQSQMTRLSNQVRETIAMMVQAPLIWSWLQRQIADPVTLRAWGSLLGKLAIVILAGVLAEKLVKRLLARQRFAFIKPRAARPLFRMISVLVRLCVAALSIAVFTLVPLFVLPFLDLDPVDLHVAFLGIGALVAVRSALLLAHICVVPHDPLLAAFDLAPEPAQAIVRWTHRLTGTLAYGLAIAWGAQALGIPGVLYTLSLKLISLLLALEMILVILRVRQPIARWLTELTLPRKPEERKPEERKPGARKSGRQLTSANLRYLIDSWHILAIIYVIVSLVLFVFDVRDGLEFALRASALSALAVAAGQFLIILSRQKLREDLLQASRFARYFPTLARRIAAWLPPLRSIITIATRAVMVFALLWSWGVNSLTHLILSVGNVLLTRLGPVAVILILALLTWEFVNIAIERQLLALGSNGASLQRRGARLQTLLPLCRNILLVAILAVSLLSLLSAIGVNITPLLAGAGVMGVAVGFGSQTLVKDMITGLFILLENTLAVGDVVDLGNGHSGVVETLSLRTIRLRDTGGAVHALPFSAVQTVINRTKDYAYHVFDQSIDIGADVELAQKTIEQVVQAMQNDPKIGPLMLGGAEIFGITELGTTGTLTIKGRIKTLPGQQWSVQRAFNALLARALPEAGIQFPRGMITDPSLINEFSHILGALRPATKPTEQGAAK